MSQAEINRIYKIVLEGYKRNYPEEITEIGRASCRERV